jgi:hypothetical protein
MLSEFENVRQIHGEDPRRLFVDPDLALYIWYRNSRISGFQFCYDKQGSEKAFMWTIDHGYSHYAVDSGEVEGLEAKKTPVLMASAIPVPEDLLARFDSATDFLDNEIRDFVSQKIHSYFAGNGRKP